MNLKELNEIYNTQMCMLDEGKGNNSSRVVHSKGCRIPEPDALVLYYDPTNMIDYKIGKGWTWPLVQEEYPNMTRWEYVGSIQKHQDTDIHTDEQNNNRE